MMRKPVGTTLKSAAPTQLGHHENNPTNRAPVNIAATTNINNTSTGARLLNTANTTVSDAFTVHTGGEETKQSTQKQLTSSNAVDTNNDENTTSMYGQDGSVRLAFSEVLKSFHCESTQIAQAKLASLYRSVLKDRSYSRDRVKMLSSQVKELQNNKSVLESSVQSQAETIAQHLKEAKTKEELIAKKQDEVNEMTKELTNLRLLRDKFNTSMEFNVRREEYLQVQQMNNELHNVNQNIALQLTAMRTFCSMLVESNASLATQLTSDEERRTSIREIRESLLKACSHDNDTSKFDSTQMHLDLNKHMETLKRLDDTMTSNFTTFVEQQQMDLRKQQELNVQLNEDFKQAIEVNENLNQTIEEVNEQLNESLKQNNILTLANDNFKQQIAMEAERHDQHVETLKMDLRMKYSTELTEANTKIEQLEKHIIEMHEYVKTSNAIFTEEEEKWHAKRQTCEAEIDELKANILHLESVIASLESRSSISGQKEQETTHRCEAEQEQELEQDEDEEADVEEDINEQDEDVQSVGSIQLQNALSKISEELHSEKLELIHENIELDTNNEPLTLDELCSPKLSRNYNTHLQNPITSCHNTLNQNHTRLQTQNDTSAMSQKVYPPISNQQPLQQRPISSASVKTNGTAFSRSSAIYTMVENLGNSLSYM